MSFLKLRIIFSANLLEPLRIPRRQPKKNSLALTLSIRNNPNYLTRARKHFGQPMFLPDIKLILPDPE